MLPIALPLPHSIGCIFMLRPLPPGGPLPTPSPPPSTPPPERGGPPGRYEARFIAAQSQTHRHEILAGLAVHAAAVLLQVPSRARARRSRARV